jgi:hypothetical protein
MANGFLERNGKGIVLFGGLKSLGGLRKKATLAYNKEEVECILCIQDAVA